MFIAARALITLPPVLITPGIPLVTPHLARLYVGFTPYFHTLSGAAPIIVEATRPLLLTFFTFLSGSPLARSLPTVLYNSFPKYPPPALLSKLPAVLTIPHPSSSLEYDSY